MTDTRVFKVALSIGEAADAVGVSKETIRRAIHTGRLKAKRTGAKTDGDGTGKYLIRVTELEAWFDGLVDA